jgi:hypothetical protein
VWCRKDRSAAALNAPRMGIFFGRITPGTPPCSIVSSNSRSTSKTILPGYDGCDQSGSATDGSWGWMHTAYGDPTAVRQMVKARWPNSSCRRRHEIFVILPESVTVTLMGSPWANCPGSAGLARPNSRRPNRRTRFPKAAVRSSRFEAPFARSMLGFQSGKQDLPPSAGSTHGRTLLHSGTRRPARRHPRQGRGVRLEPYAGRGKLAVGRRPRRSQASRRLLAGGLRLARAGAAAQYAAAVYGRRAGAEPPLHSCARRWLTSPAAPATRLAGVVPRIRGADRAAPCLRSDRSRPQNSCTA